MKFGLTELFGNLRFYKGTNYVGFAPPASVPTSYNFTLPSAPPGSTQALVSDSAGALSFQALGGGGTVTSVALSAPSIFSVGGSPVSSSGTLALTFATGQTANRFLASPDGSAGALGLRAIAWGDVSGLAGTSSNSFAAGNDSRLHSQNTDTGTTQTSFLIDSGGTPIRLKASAGALQLRNNADNGNVDLLLANLTLTGNLTVQGTTTTVNSETMTVDDNSIVLNNNVSTGTPTENGGIELRRGASTSAAILWDETTDEWQSGLVGSTLPIARVYRTTFTNASLTAGVLTVTHNLGQQYVTATVVDNNAKVVLPDEITFSSTSALAIDLTSFGTLTGTWRVVITG